MPARMAWAWKSGPVSMTTLWPSHEMRTEGRVRRLRGSPVGDVAEVQTAQVHPSVGTPIDVPEPRNVSVASMKICRFSIFQLSAFGCQRSAFSSKCGDSSPFAPLRVRMTTLDHWTDYYR